ncbi:MAG: molybdopterin-dependent oxidoreductase [Lachnospiraceae bacterium]|nr:molybdopterin-dependent oxidoreductase [Lachnospiraceae bacterium]
MSKWIDQMTNRPISRRAFLRGSALATVAVAGLSLTGCSDNKVNESAAGSSPAESTTEAAKTETSAETSEAEVGTGHAPAADPEEGGTWISAACWHNCGGRCVNKVLVKDGAVIRQKTDDSHEDSYEYPQQRGCVRGKAQQQQCFGADRLKYPMKRKNWQPGGGENARGDLRGKDEWERISWEEAFKLVAEETLRVRDEYGMEAIINFAAAASTSTMLKYNGGFSRYFDTDSYGTYTLSSPMAGLSYCDLGETNDRFDLVNADTIVLYSSNPAWSAAGLPSFLLTEARDKGVRFIVVDPLYNSTAQMLDAEWIPVHGGTDMAFMLAVAYEMLRLDGEGEELIDWDFLNQYTVGFDAEHMPADAKLAENFKDYVLGAYDDTPKTPEWASPLCGAPAEQITEFARAIGKKNKVMLFHNYGFARCYGAEGIPQMFMTLGAMGGHMGKSGHCCGSAYHANAFNAGPRLVKAGSSEMPSFDNTVEHIFPGPDFARIVIEGAGKPYRFVGNCYGGMFPGEDRIAPDVRGFYYTTGAYLQTGMNMKKHIEAVRTLDFVFCYAQFMTPCAQYSDVVLPVTTEWERPGMVAESNRETLIISTQVTEPLYEAKSDQEIESGILKAMGVDPEPIFPKSLKQQYFEKLTGCTVIKEDGSDMEPLITITQEDIDEWEVEGKPQEGRIGLAELIEKGSYQVERKRGDKFGYIGYENYVKDPEANKRSSESGKLEIYCQAFADLINSFGLNDQEYKPYPSYIVPPLGYETTFKNNQVGGEKGDYPYVLYNPHYLRRSHSTFDNCGWLREQWKNPVFLNASDAKDKGVATGDTVLISTPFGQVLRNAVCVETLIPGQVGIPHGSWVDIDEKTGIDRGGSDNYLIGDTMSGMGVSGYNNCNCDFEKYSGDALPEDWQRPVFTVDLD